MPEPKDETTVERVDRERKDAEAKNRVVAERERKRATVLGRMIQRAHDEIQRRGEHAGPDEVGAFLVSNGVKGPDEMPDAFRIPEHWPKMGPSERPEEA